VHDGRHFIGASFVHRPRPFELKIFDVGRVDLFERAEAPTLVIAPEHEPVAIRRFTQHRLGDWRVGRYLSGDGKAAAQRWHCLAARNESRRHLAAGDMADLHRCLSSEWRAARGGPIGFEEKCHNVLIRLIAQASALTQRHGGMEIFVQIPCRTVPPRLEKIPSRKGRSLTAASQILLMTAGASSRVFAVAL
jgi:hypothetical protein